MKQIPVLMHNDFMATRVRLIWLLERVNLYQLHNLLLYPCWSWLHLRFSFPRILVQSNFQFLILHLNHFTKHYGTTCHKWKHPSTYSTSSPGPCCAHISEMTHQYGIPEPMVRSLCSTSSSTSIFIRKASLWSAWKQQWVAVMTAGQTITYVNL